MEAFRKTLATICAILFIITTVIALFAFNFDQKAFSAETYQAAFAKEEFYNKLPVLMAETMASTTNDQNNFPVALQGMGEASWESFFRSLLPPNILKAMGDDALNSTFAYVNMEADAAHLTLIPLKASLAGDSSVQAVYALLRTQPECTFMQITQMGIDLLSGGKLQLCNPPEDLYPLLTPVIQEQLQFTALAIPDQVEIIRAPLQNDPRPKLKNIRLIMRFSLILPIILLLALTVFAVRSMKEWLSWWGIPLLISGGIAFVISLAGTPLVKIILQGILVARLPTYVPSILLEFAGDLASAMADALLHPILWQGLIITVIGLGMATASYFLKEREGNITY